MKQCPVCKTAYTDDSLKFCLSDGTSLVFMPEAEKTIQMSLGNETVRANAAGDSVPTVFPPVKQNAPAGKGFGLIVAGLIACLLLLAFAGLGAFLLLKPNTRQDDKIPVAAASPTATISQTPAPNDETAALKEKLANLEKQVQAQKNQKQTAPEKPPANQNQPPKPPSNTARVNSPGDGFLALRDEPDSETGYRIAKIPHGAIVTIIDCPKSSNVGKMPGRWCRVIYNEQTGWAFDGFLVR